MNTIILNGERHQVQGKNIIITSSSITVDGINITNISADTRELKVSFEGDLANIDCTNLVVNGNVNGSVDCTNFKGEDVHGNIDATNVNIKGNHTGDIKATNVKL